MMDKQIQSTSEEDRPWQLAVIESVATVGPRVTSVVVRLPNWSAPRPGQTCEIRLTAPEGYQSARRYYICSTPDAQGVVEVAIEDREDDPLASFFHGPARAGDIIQARGPLDGGFTWPVDLEGPLLLVAGGVGIVPLMALLRHRRSIARGLKTQILYSTCTAENLLFHDELEALTAADSALEMEITATQKSSLGRLGFSRRIDRNALRQALKKVEATPLCYVCGSASFVEAMDESLRALEIPAERIFTAPSRFPGDA